VRAKQKLTRLLAGSVLSLALCGPAMAQWSLLAPGARVAQPGASRSYFLVITNPVPGHEAEFNDWYNNTHLGDLGQLSGYDGVQRFRLISSVTPRPTEAGYRFGYLCIWDMERADNQKPTGFNMNAAFDGGKLRRGAYYDYAPGMAITISYKVMGPRILRPDGRKATMPADTEYTHPRPDRFILMDFSDAAPGTSEADFNAALDKHIQQVLAVPGWMAAQKLEFIGRGNAKPELPRHLVVWEIEGPAQAAQDALTAATAKGAVTPVNLDKTSWQATYWMPITPYVTKDDFAR
jgi:hypothetical protein